MASLGTVIFSTAGLSSASLPAGSRSTPPCARDGHRIEIQRCQGKLSLQIDGDRLVRDLETLATIGADAQGGVTRIAYSREDREGREWVRAEFAALGLSETTDSAGNDTWVYPGTESGLAPLALGSHTDTVPNGGRYDGALGVLSALAAGTGLVPGEPAIAASR